MLFLSIFAEKDTNYEFIITEYDDLDTPIVDIFNKLQTEGYDVGNHVQLSNIQPDTWFYVPLVKEGVTVMAQCLVKVLPNCNTVCINHNDLWPEVKAWS